MGIGWANMKFASGRDWIEEIKISISHTYQNRTDVHYQKCTDVQPNQKEKQTKEIKALRAI